MESLRSNTDINLIEVSVSDTVTFYDVSYSFVSSCQSNFNEDLKYTVGFKSIVFLLINLSITMMIKEIYICSFYSLPDIFS